MSMMPSKNRSIMLGVAALALAVMVGFWATRNNAEPQQQAADPDAANVAGNTNTNTNTDSSTPLDAAAPVSTDTTTGTSNLGAGEQDETATPVMGNVPESHEVKAGETLSSIAQQYYGNSAYAGDIEALNDLENPDRLEVGQKLMLPRPEALPALAR